MKVNKFIKLYDDGKDLQKLKGYFDNNENLHEKHVRIMFIKLAKNGYLDIVKYFVDKFNDYLDYRNSDGLINRMYRHGIKIYEYEHITKTYHYNLKRTLNIALKLSCKSGHLHVAQYLYSVGAKFNCENKVESIFRICCYYGYLHIFKWICETDAILNANNKMIYKIVTNKAIMFGYFCCACNSKYFDLILWLHDGVKDYIVSNKTAYRVFDIICRCKYHDNIQIAKWFQKLYNDQLKPYYKHIFISVCRYSNNMELNKWLYELGNINMYMEYIERELLDYTYTISYLNQTFEKINWFCSLNKNYKCFKNKRNNYYCRKLTAKDHIIENIDEYYKSADIIEDQICSSCINDQDEKMIKIDECKHILCLDCYIELKQCPFGCKYQYIKCIDEIPLSGLHFLINKTD